MYDATADNWRRKFEEERRKLQEEQAKVQELREVLKKHDIIEHEKKYDPAQENQQKKQREETERTRQRESHHNIIFGVGVAFLLAIVILAQTYDTLEAAYWGCKWLAFIVFAMFVLASFYLALSYVCGSKSVVDDELDAGHVSTVDHSRCNQFVTTCMMLTVAFLALGQFQLYFGLLAWAYPYLVEPKALMNAEFAYDPLVREFNLTEIAAEMDWTYELKEVQWKTAYREKFGYETDFICPDKDHVAIAAHTIPIVAALIYQFGIGVSGLVGISGIVMDFVDTQDFYLLLLENEIVVSHWSKPREKDENELLGMVEVNLSNNQTHTFHSTEKRFECWQKESVLYWGEKLGVNFIFGFELDGPYYNYNMWSYIMLSFISASLYVSLWPFFAVVFYRVMHATKMDLKLAVYAHSRADADRVRLLRTSLSAVQTFLSLILVEIPFLFLRCACSQYYGIAMSSLFIKNIVSIMMDTLKLIVYFTGFSLSADYGRKEVGELNWEDYFKKYLLRLTTIGNFIGENFEKDTKHTLALCPCCRSEQDGDEDEEHKYYGYNPWDDSDDVDDTGDDETDDEIK